MFEVPLVMDDVMAEEQSGWRQEVQAKVLSMARTNVKDRCFLQSLLVLTLEV